MWTVAFWLTHTTPFFEHLLKSLFCVIYAQPVKFASCSDQLLNKYKRISGFLEYFGCERISCKWSLLGYKLRFCMKRRPCGRRRCDFASPECPQGSQTLIMSFDIWPQARLWCPFWLQSSCVSTKGRMWPSFEIST